MTEWLLTDLHIHTTFSDGTVSVEEVVKIHGKAGFDAIAITDHLFDTQSPRGLEIYDEGKSVKDPKSYFRKIEEVSRWAKETYDLLVIPGLEICNLLEDYHILGIDLKEAVNPNQNAEGVIDEIHRQGGLAIASHPPLKLSYFLNGDKESIRRHPLHLWKHREKYADKIDAWEIANREDLFSAVSLEHLPFVANSDFHERPHLTGWKSLIRAEKEKEAIKQAILQRNLSLFFFSENGSKGSRGKTKVCHEETERVEQKGGGGKGKVLIVDDERDLVAMVAYNLGKKGYQISTAYNGFEAWEKIESEKPDLLILDLMMPDLDGWELCRLVRRSQTKEINDIGILMLTARAMPEDRVYGLEIGADDYLTKPFSLSELILRVEKLAGKRKSVYELKEQMKCLQSSMYRKETDLKRVVHDLRNPLLSIGASAKRMLRRSQNEEELKMLGMIYDSSVRLTGWVDDTLSSSKLEAEIREVDIQQLIGQVINSLKETSEEKRIEICFDSSASIPHLFCHEQLMFRTIENLLSNALKYTPYGGKVDIAIIPYLQWKEGGFVEISIQDTGIGILEDEIERIFEPFYRGRNNSTQAGVGLGLSFAKQAVEFHGGKILVQSEPQKGSIFSILLPIQARIKLSEAANHSRS
ncbi:MAG TPA: response regulator [Thermodesulfobacteriota bacterium]|nr:response regulator [Thermodesulfobacteriota bacterium]